MFSILPLKKDCCLERNNFIAITNDKVANDNDKVVDYDYDSDNDSSNVGKRYHCLTPPFSLTCSLSPLSLSSSEITKLNKH